MKGIVSIDFSSGGGVRNGVEGRRGFVNTCGLYDIVHE